MEEIAEVSNDGEEKSPRLDGRQTEHDGASTPGCLVRIQSSLGSLTKGERLIAETILADPHSIILASVRELAKRSNTSDAAVTRFARKLGYKSYPEFKVILSRDLVSPIKDIHEDIETDENVEGIRNKVVAANVQALNDTLQVLDTEALTQAIELIENADRLAFFGFGASRAVSLDARHKFLRTGKETLVFADSHEQAMWAAMCNPGDVLMLFSHTGSTRELIEVSEIAKGRGARIITVTSHGRSSITELADVKLFTSARETRFRPESLSSRIAALTIVDVLYVGVAMRLQEQILEHRPEIRAAISRKRL